LICTYIFEMVAFLSAASLCFRNWRSSQIVSGRTVWLYLGLGTLFYLLGTFGFGVWELVFNVDPLVSPGDLFYIASYICLGCGMGLAVTSRRLNLELWQWGVFAAIAAIGVILAFWVYNLEEPVAEEAMLSPPVIEEVSYYTPALDVLPTLGAVQAPIEMLLLSPTDRTELGTPSLVQASPQPSPTPSPDATSSPESLPPSEGSPPGWVVSLENLLEPLESIVNIFYVIVDIGLLIVATALLLAFWGGRFAQSWRMIAAAAVCLYIADIYTVYADTAIPDYQSGAFLEVFYIFSGVLFGIGAALEYSTSSSRSRRGSRRRA